MTRIELYRSACLAVGVDPVLASAAALAFARLEAGIDLRPGPAPALDMVALIRSAFDFTRPPVRRMTATEVCRAAGIPHPSRAQTTAAGVALTQLTGRKPFKTNGRHVYVMPAGDVALSE